MPIKPSVLIARIENAAAYVGPLWPLQTFNSANPLSGFEDRPFDEAVQQARRLFGGRGYPRASTFRQAWDDGEIRPAILADRLKAHGIEETPDVLLDRMAADETLEPSRLPADDPLNRIMAKWLAAYLDQGQAAWSMPGRRGEGFYAAWRRMAPYDGDVPDVSRPGDLPATKLAAFEAVLGAYPESRWEPIFVHHLTALPGWVGFIRWRTQAGDHAWQQAHPITLGDYLAVRLTLAARLGRTIAPDRSTDLPASGTTEASLASIWLEAWEESYRGRLLEDLEIAAEERSLHANGHAGDGAVSPRASNATEDASRPDAQWVFCIDVRSEILRRHLEAQGDHETHGYAGFFGIPMQHDGYDAEVSVKACPPILDPKHRIAERPRPECEPEAQAFDARSRLRSAASTVMKSLKANVAAAFGFVEGAGGFFSGVMALRTLAPRLWERWTGTPVGEGPESFCAPTVDRPPMDDPEANPASGELPLGLSDEAKVVYAEAAFRLMGWTTFAPVVVLTGHGSQTPNNPYKSSLDCGACAGNPGGPNARVLAAICNNPAVRESLRERGIDIPDDTVFIAAQHNTTTDAVTLFVDDEDPPVSASVLQRLRDDLAAAQAGAAEERVRTMNARRPTRAVQEIERRASDWAETRPEWGLAGNAGFIVGRRALTQDLTLDGRCFLHSYDWREDDDGTLLETILTGPLVVGEWINMQYYFSTVDNAVYGSGSKVTHNVVGNLGILQGNGGDLMSGLPLQSLQADDIRVQHRPIRLLAVIEAPPTRVDAILKRQDTLRRLFDHEWIALAVLDPENHHRVTRYRPGGTWDVSDTPDASPEAVATA